MINVRKIVTAMVVPLAAITAVPGAVASASASPKGGYSVEIRRTAYGVPHIQAADFASLGYGEGYAFAQDNLCVMASRLVTLRGERSRYFGPDASNGDAVAPASNLSSDVFETAERRSGIVRRLVAEPEPLGPTRQVRDLVRGYVAGYNRYLADTGVAHLPDPTCRNAAWVFPMSESDFYQNVYDLAGLLGTQSAIDQIATATPPSGNSSAPPAEIGQREVKAGSNAFGLGRDATRNNGGMVLGNPHFPWYGPERFYQMQLTIPGRLNVSGAALYGTPVVEIGHTEHVAWSHTVDTANPFTMFRLTLAPGDPTSYIVDGHREAMSRHRVSVQVKDSAGHLSAVTRTLYNSRYGPVLAGGWTTTTAYAIRDANAKNMRLINTWLGMDQSDSVAGLRAAADHYQGIPWVNTIAADSTGTAYYAEASAVPHVTDAQLERCGVPSRGRQIVLNGSSSACAWGSDPDAIEPGIFGPAEEPRLVRSDYVTNSNASPWLTNPQAPITGFPQIFGDVGTPRPLRTRLGLDMVAQRLAGTDGYGPAGFDLPSLQHTMLGDRELSAELLTGRLVTYCRAHPTLTATDGSSVDVRAACRVLGHWDRRADPGSASAVLWREFMLAAPQDAGLYRVPFDPAHPLTTPRDLNTANPAVGRALADAVQHMTELHVPLDEPLGKAQRYAGIPIPGCPNLEGCFNVVEPSGDRLQANGAYPDVNFGSSFIMAVAVTPAGPRARTILTYSESANPASPHHTDQTRLFSSKGWVTERFTESDIAADPQLQTIHLAG